MPEGPACVRRHFSDGATTPVVKDRLVPQDPAFVRRQFSDGAASPVVKDRLPVGASSNALHTGGREGSSIYSFYQDQLYILGDVYGT